MALWWGKTQGGRYGPLRQQGDPISEARMLVAEGANVVIGA
jgi:hypothetical protein